MIGSTWLSGCLFRETSLTQQETISAVLQLWGIAILIHLCLMLLLDFEFYKLQAYRILIVFIELNWIEFIVRCRGINSEGMEVKGNSNTRRLAFKSMIDMLNE